MAQVFLEQESINANRKKQKLFLSLFLFFNCISIFLYFATRNLLDWNNPSDRKLVGLFFALAGIMLFCVLFGLLVTMRPAKNGNNLILPFAENSKEAIAEVINREVAEGKTQFESFINYNTVKKYGDRVLLLPSYLLLIGEMGQITAIPRGKIYWICAQVGYKGGPFYVRLLIFTEQKIFDFDGNDIEHTKEIANGLYQYIPNAFREYDPQELSYLLEKLYQENRAGFLAFYEEEKRKKNTETGIS